jgi:prophage antirepressor-like protein
MEELRTWNFEDHEVRTVEIDGEPWFVLADACKVLELSNPSMVAKKLDDDERTKFDLGRQGETTIINESGLYTIVLRSDKPQAKPFRKWVTSEVLPSIRKTGSYTYRRTNPNEEKALQIQEMDTRIRMSEQFLKLAEIETTLSKNYRDILISKSVEALAGEQLLPLPKVTQKTYSAKEVGEMLGVTAQRIGRIANLNNMKTDEFGEFYKDKSPYSSKEVDVFRYNDKAVEQFKKLLA